MEPIIKGEIVRPVDLIRLIHKTWRVAKDRATPSLTNLRRMRLGMCVLGDRLSD